MEDDGDGGDNDDDDDNKKNLVKQCRKEERKGFGWIR